MREQGVAPYEAMCIVDDTTDLPLLRIALAASWPMRGPACAILQTA